MFALRTGHGLPRRTIIKETPASSSSSPTLASTPHLYPQEQITQEQPHSAHGPFSMSKRTRRFRLALKLNSDCRFVGFHREQVHKAKPHVFHGKDYRQAVYCQIDKLSPVQWRILANNMAGEEVPREYRQGNHVSAIRQIDVLFRDGLDENGEGENADDFQVWIPTPDDRPPKPSRLSLRRSTRSSRGLLRRAGERILDGDGEKSVPDSYNGLTRIADAEDGGLTAELGDAVGRADVDMDDDENVDKGLSTTINSVGAYSALLGLFSPGFDTK